MRKRRWRVDNSLVIDEYNPLEPPSAGHQRKFYSEGTGLVKVTAVGGVELSKSVYAKTPRAEVATPRDDDDD